MSYQADPGPFRALSKPAALSLVAMIYLIALLVGAGVLWVLFPTHVPPLWQMFAADVAATVVVFAFSVGLNNSSMYDPYWSVIPIPIAIYWALVPGAEAPLLRKVLIIGLVAWWGVRLTYNWARGWSSFAHEDWRYVNIREQTGWIYWPVSFLGIHLFPTVQVFLGMIPVYYAMQSPVPLGLLDGVAAAVTALGVAWEMIADKQLRIFTLTEKKQGDTFTGGLWAFSRHPNYFGEMTLWVGLALFAAAAGQYQWWCYVGAISMIIMFNVVSIPMIDKRMCASRPHYAERMRRVNRVIPWFSKS